MKTWKVILAVGLCFSPYSIYPAEGEYSIEDIAWQIGSTLPGACKGQAQAVIGEFIIGVGGAESGKRASDTAWRLDTRTLQYELLPKLPAVVSYPQGAAVGKAFYLFTGSIVDESKSVDKWSKRMFRLSQSAGAWAWKEMPSLGTGRLFPGAAVSGSMIIVIGGEVQSARPQSKAEASSVEIFDTQAPEKGWRSLTDFPGRARQSMAVASIGKEVYLFGGMNWQGDGVARSSHAYSLNLDTNRWKRLADLPFPAFGWEAVVYEGRYIIMAGGIKGSSSKSSPNFDVLVFDSLRQTYDVLPSKVPPYQIHAERYVAWVREALVKQVHAGGMNPSTGVYRHGPELSLVGERLYLCGGEVVSPDLNITCEVLIGTIRRRKN